MTQNKIKLEVSENVINVLDKITKRVNKDITLDDIVENILIDYCITIAKTYNEKDFRNITKILRVDD